MAGKLTDSGKYFIDYTIPCYQVDANKRLKPSAYMDIAQEMAYLAANHLKFGYSQLQNEGHAWVLSRMNFKFVKVPMWREDVQVFTWHRGPMGPFYVRDFNISDADGTQRVLGTSSWVILDVNTRHMVRGSDVMELVPESSICKDFAVEQPAQKVVLPKTAVPEFVGEHIVEYSDIDLLGHTNNAMYVQWGMNCIDYEVAKNNLIKEVTINFNHETLSGDVVKLYRYRDNDNWYVEGKVDDKSAFVLKVDF